jgi:hypothetical protein
MHCAGAGGSAPIRPASSAIRNLRLLPQFVNENSGLRRQERSPTTAIHLPDVNDFGTFSFREGLTSECTASAMIPPLLPFQIDHVKPNVETGRQTSDFGIPEPRNPDFRPQPSGLEVGQHSCFRNEGTQAEVQGLMSDARILL